ncbi:uncharacterized protein RHOBADRAFT_54447 [Rhodotorula graminis WP1]|uniref:GDP-fucose protein O-fucosyltransferase 2 n=1 Tax=Rhodotorula graminis (strain WP1) TaxID=578459 RepID=A0A0N8Q014_RHOGW|nr:uncharacterized protein RHOBADRAFT_54447 [Rhodotorula graminis WP1]KPV73853.1 hypothetical protein RHOBADRAFT_54447 [Rhodotorula graminis WP1]
MTRPHSPSGPATLPSTPDLGSSSSAAAPGSLRRDHSAYDLPSRDSAYADDKDADLERAYRSGSTSAHSAGSPLLPSSPSTNSAAKSPPLLAHLGGLTRRVSRRALLAGLVGLAVLVKVLGAASSDKLGDAPVLEQLRSAKELVQQSVADRWAAFRWHNGQDTVEDDDFEFEPLDPLLVLNYNTSRPTIKEQLKPGLRYVATMAYGGHANQMISINKMLYFAKVTGRVAIIPSLMPIHIDGNPENISSFYDLGRFWAEARIPAVQFADVKPMDLRSERPQNEHLACWSIQELLIGFANLQAWSFDLHDVWVDHWPLPPLARGGGGFDVAFDALRMFDFDVGAKTRWIEQVRREVLPQKAPVDPEVPFEGDKAKNLKDGFDTVSAAPPDHQLMCFDNSLFIGSVMFQEPHLEPVPLEPTVPGEGLDWVHAGQYMRFNREVERRADDYLMELFGVSRASEIPPFITIHLRRGDFKEFTGFTALDKYVSALERVQAALQNRLDNPYDWTGPGRFAFRTFDGLSAKDYAVVTTTDERGDTPFVQEVRALGWKVLDHDAFDTKRKMGGWWPTMLDAAILARGRSFVGTHASTFSHMAGLRVKYWRGGLVEVAS